MPSRFMKFLVLPLAGAALLLGGCVNQGEYDRLYETNASLSSQLTQAQRERDEARAALDLLRKNYGNSSGALASLQEQNDQLRRQLDAALADYNSLEARLAGLQFGPLPAEVNAALTALADQYPDLIKFDASRGMLRFASDLTFDSGSDVVKEQAKQALAAFARILNSSAAASYDVIIEGHTDSQRISQASTRAKHPTNRHLSAHRSIAVIDDLMKLGVQPGRLMAAGWGEYRPAVPNTPSGNTPANRRVEIFLVKSTGAAPAAETVAPATLTNVNPGREEPPARPADISK
jgi:chemotaxis protein MotB